MAIACENYPSDSRFKLYQRLAKAQEATKDFSAAIESYKSLIANFETAKLTARQVAQLKTEAELALKSCRKNLTLTSIVQGSLT